MNPWMRSLELKVPPVLQMVVAGLLMLGISAATPSLAIPVPVRVWAAIVCLLAGIAAALLGLGAFRDARTTVDPRTPEKSSRLVTTGVYRWTRNPMYLGFLLMLVSWALYLANLSAFMLVTLFAMYITRFQIIPEERFMHEKFGEEYRRYAQSVRRWL